MMGQAPAPMHQVLSQIGQVLVGVGRILARICQVVLGRVGWAVLVRMGQAVPRRVCEGVPGQMTWALHGTMGRAVPGQMDQVLGRLMRPSFPPSPPYWYHRYHPAWVAVC